MSSPSKKPQNEIAENGNELPEIARVAVIEEGEPVAVSDRDNSRDELIMMKKNNERGRSRRARRAYNEMNK